MWYPLYDIFESFFTNQGFGSRPTTNLDIKSIMRISNFDTLMNLTFIILDAVVIFLMISTIIETSKAIAAFELDPRSRPPFDLGRARKFETSWGMEFYKF